MTKPKPAAELTTEGALRRLFPKEARHIIKQMLLDAETRATRFEVDVKGKKK